MKPPIVRSRSHAESAVRLPCACANLRRAARLVSQAYNEALAPIPMPITQFTLLQALALAPGVSQKQLGDLLGIDSTTLTRTLAGLRRKAWLGTRPGSDRRETRLSLTAAGEREYQRALPYWESAQNHLRKALGESQWRQVIDSSVRIANVVPTIEERETSVRPAQHRS